MFRRLRQLEISLAAKCQLLFGAALVLIIAAALFVPWQRMEPLTNQMNRRTAQALADTAISQHVAWQTSGTPQMDPILSPTVAAATPAILPLTPDGRQATVARLVIVGPPSKPAVLTSFEKHASDFFRQNPDAEFIARIYHNNVSSLPGYRYARALRADQNCIHCHAPGGLLRAPSPHEALWGVVAAVSAGAPGGNSTPT